MGLFGVLVSSLDVIPGVGHIKGVYHYAIGEDEAGDRAMLAASRTTAVIGAGAVGMIGGPVVAVGAAAAAGASSDFVVAAVSNGKHVNGIAKVAKNPTDPKAFVSAVADTVSDAVTGGVAGAVVKKGVGKTVVAVGNKVLHSGPIGTLVAVNLSDQIIKGIPVEPWSTADEVLTRAVAGDLIEFRRLRGVYCHWAVYVGSGYVINYGRKDPDTSIVQRERVTTVSDGDPCRINNLVVAAKRRNLEPLNGKRIVERAEAKLGEEANYNFMFRNCEVFATECRYGRGFTCQPDEFLPVSMPGLDHIHGVFNKMQCNS